MNFQTLSIEIVAERAESVDVADVFERRSAGEMEKYGGEVSINELSVEERTGRTVILTAEVVVEFGSGHDSVHSNRDEKFMSTVLERVDDHPNIDIKEEEVDYL